MRLTFLTTAPGRHLSALAGGLLLLTAACAEDSTAPLTAPDGLGTPELAVLDKRSDAPGIVFGSWNMRNSNLNSVHTGWMNGGPLDPKNIVTWLSGARAKDGRVIIKLCKGRDSYVKNSDGTFSLSKWKYLVSRYKNINLGPYINDGTVLAHMLIDEPHRANRWGGKPISPATLEQMAAYSKQLWPGMQTVVGEEARWLGKTSVTYRHLDAAWPQYRANMGDASSWASAEIAAAQKKGLGVVIGMNVMDGGNGSSKIRGRTSGKWAMSATELRNYGSALLNKSYVCGYFSWTYDSDYYDRSDIRKAMADLSAKARKHAKTACRQ